MEMLNRYKKYKLCSWFSSFGKDKIHAYILHIIIMMKYVLSTIIRANNIVSEIFHQANNLY
jgi:hypothetical protein